MKSTSPATSKSGNNDDLESKRSENRSIGENNIQPKPIQP